MKDRVKKQLKKRLKKRFNHRREILALSILLLSVFLGACGSRENRKASGTGEYDVYYLNMEETKVLSEVYKSRETQTDKILPELIEQLSTQPENVELKAAISEDFGVLNYSIEESQVLLNLDVRYLQMDTTKEVLTRAAIVRTLTQIKGIEYVSFNVENEPLQDKNGNFVGTMNADMFIDNAGTEINSYEKTKLHLYFANETGDGLIEVNRTIVYNSNISLDKLVVEQIIQGPSNDQSYPTTNPKTKIMSVTTTDGTCYVNLDEGFLTEPYNVTTDVSIYSIVNSLVELSNINKVQFSINGKTDVTYREKVDLNTIFERNLELID